MSFQQFSLGEVETIEEIAGETLGAIFATASAKPSAKLITGFALVMRQRTDPEFTLEQARALPYSEAIELFSAAMADDDPKDEPSIEASPAAAIDSSSSSATS